MHDTASRHNLDLRAENAELRERVRQLEKILSDPLPVCWNLPLPVMKGRLLSLLYRTPGLVTRDRLEAAIHGVDSEVDEKCLEVHLCQLRRRLKPHGITIETVRGTGYRLSAESRAKVRALISKQAKASEVAVNGSHRGDQHAVEPRA